MPISARHGEPMPLDSPDDVAALVGHLERRDREPAWLGDHFACLAGTRPEWFRPFQETAPVVWHYASLRLRDIPGLPAFPAQRAHLVAPASPCIWTVFADVGAGDDPDFGVGRVVLRPYGPDLIYSNGHVQSTPGVVGTAGGPPIGLYPNPCCPSCKRLMFHVATMETYVREHGDGFRSLYLCEDCHKVAVTATGWN